MLSLLVCRTRHFPQFPGRCGYPPLHRPSDLTGCSVRSRQSPSVRPPPPVHIGAQSRPFWENAADGDRLSGRQCQRLRFLSGRRPATSSVAGALRPGPVHPASRQSAPVHVSPLHSTSVHVSPRQSAPVHVSSSHFAPRLVWSAPSRLRRHHSASLRLRLARS